MTAFPRNLIAAHGRLARLGIGGLAMGLLSITLSGCVVGSADIVDEVDAVAWDLRPTDLDAQVELSFGRAVLGLASTAARWSDDHDAELAADLVDEIDEVHVGIYDLHRGRSDSPHDIGPDAREELEDLGWQLVVRTREWRDESRWVFARPDRRGANTEVLVVGIEEDELVVLKLEGDLGGIVDQAVRRENDLVVLARETHHDHR